MRVNFICSFLNRYKKMSLNKFMHTRNPFHENPPNYLELSKLYPEFKQYCLLDAKNNLIKLNYNDPETLKALYCVLMKEYFGLEVNIPLDHLIPRVPQRLNYILWIEDLLDRPEKAIGIDIGSGPGCVFSLLACSLNKEWSMICSDISERNIKWSRENVDKNELSDRISIYKVEKDSVILGLLNLVDKNEKYRKCQIDFLMCNPPFYATEEELKGQGKQIRDPLKRPRACSINTAQTNEAIYENDGEVGFVKRIVDESLQIGPRIKVYSSMFGKKSSLSALKTYLKREKHILNVCEAQFCQGNTMRWGVAWSFHEQKLTQFDYKKSNDKNAEPYALNCELSKEFFTNNYQRDYIFNFLLQTFTNDLKFDILRVDSSRFEADFSVIENSWSNQRAKRRKMLKTNGQCLETEEKNQLLDFGFSFYTKLIEQSSPTNIKIQLKLDLQKENAQNAKLKEYLNQILQFLKNKIK